MTLTLESLKIAFRDRPFQFYPQAGSTNDIAREWLAGGAEHGAEHGAFVTADEQISGRGRMGRAWQTPAGTALAVSVILKPRAEVLHQVVMLGALSVAEAIEHFQVPHVGIKWPNDVLLAGKKVSGVLSEAQWQGDRLQGVILGIGINVRVDFTGTELETTATSIEHLVPRRVDRTALLMLLMRRIDAWSNLLGSEALFQAWVARLETLGREVTVNVSGERVKGHAERVTPQGALVLRMEDGSTREILAGDVGM